jgi:hypothetical protein
MRTLSKSIGILAVTGALLLSGPGLTQQTQAAPKCIVKGNVDVASGKTSKDFKFKATKSFKPKLEITFYGDKKGEADAWIWQGGSPKAGWWFEYTTKKQTKTFTFDKLNKSNTDYKLNFINNGKKTLHVTSFCLHN